MNIRNIAMIGVCAIALAACGRVVPAGYTGVKVKNYGSNSGVQPTPLGNGWQGKGFGEDIVLYPNTQKTYAYTATITEGNPNNEEILFSDNTGLSIAADVAVTMRVDSAKAPFIYSKYRLDTDQLINGPIRTAVRSAINAESEKMTSEQIYTGGKTTILDNAKMILQKRYGQEGIEIVALDWIGNIRYPQPVMEAITLKTTKIQEAEAAKADQAKFEAQAAGVIAQANGEAQAMRIKGEAIRANPQILQQAWINKWDGVLPTTIAGNNSEMLLNLQK